MSEPILKVEGVQAKYGDFIAVESATLDVPEGRSRKIHSYGYDCRVT